MPVLSSGLIVRDWWNTTGSPSHEDTEAHVRVGNLLVRRTDDSSITIWNVSVPTAPTVVLASWTFPAPYVGHSVNPNHWINKVSETVVAIPVLDGSSNGRLLFVDVSTPATPTVAGVTPVVTNFVQAMDCYRFDNYLFVAQAARIGTGGVPGLFLCAPFMLFDISNLASPTLLDTYDASDYIDTTAPKDPYSTDICGSKALVELRPGVVVAKAGVGTTTSSTWKQSFGGYAVFDISTGSIVQNWTYNDMHDQNGVRPEPLYGFVIIEGVAYSVGSPLTQYTKFSIGEISGAPIEATDQMTGLPGWVFEATGTRIFAPWGPGYGAILSTGTTTNHDVLLTFTGDRFGNARVLDYYGYDRDATASVDTAPARPTVGTDEVLYIGGIFNADIGWSAYRTPDVVYEDTGSSWTDPRSPMGASGEPSGGVYGDCCLQTFDPFDFISSYANASIGNIGKMWWFDEPNDQVLATVVKPSSTERGLAVFNVSNPSSISLVSLVWVPTMDQSIDNFVPYYDALSQVLYYPLSSSTVGNPAIRSYDVSTPASPVLLDTINVISTTRLFSVLHIEKWNNYLYLSGGSVNLDVVDASNPADLIWLANISASWIDISLAVSGDYLLVGSTADTWKAFDLSVSPTAPTEYSVTNNAYYNGGVSQFKPLSNEWVAALVPEMNKVQIIELSSFPPPVIGTLDAVCTGTYLNNVTDGTRRMLELPDRKSIVVNAKGSVSSASLSLSSLEPIGPLGTPRAWLDGTNLADSGEIPIYLGNGYLLWHRRGSTGHLLAVFRAIEPTCPTYTLPDGTQAALAPVVGNGITQATISLTSDGASSGTITPVAPRFDDVATQDGNSVVLSGVASIDFNGDIPAGLMVNGSYGGKRQMYLEHYGGAAGWTDDTVSHSASALYNGAASQTIAVPVNGTTQLRTSAVPSLTTYAFLADTVTSVGARLVTTRTANMGTDPITFTTDRETASILQGVGRSTRVPGTATTHPNIDWSRAVTEGDGTYIDFVRTGTTEYMTYKLAPITATSASAILLATTLRSSVSGYTNVTARILSKDRVVAAANVGLTPQTVITTVPLTFCRRTIKFDWVNPDATVADFADCYVEYSWTAPASGSIHFDWIASGGVVVPGISVPGGQVAAIPYAVKTHIAVGRSDNVGTSDQISVIDISSPASLVLDAQYTTVAFNTSIRQMLVASDDVMYVIGGDSATRGFLIAYNVSDPTNIQVLGSVTEANDSELIGAFDCCFVGGDQDRILINCQFNNKCVTYDISNPSNLTRLGSFAPVRQSSVMRSLGGDIVIMASNGGDFNTVWYTYNVSNPSSGTLLDTLGEGGSPTTGFLLPFPDGTVLAGGRLTNNNIYKINASNPASLSLIGSPLNNGNLQNSAEAIVIGADMYQLSYAQKILNKIDATTPSAPTLTASQTIRTGTQGLKDLVYAGGFIWISDDGSDILSGHLPL